MFYVVEVGDLDVQVPNGVLSTKVQLHDALHTLDMGLTVVLIGCILKASCMVQFENRTCKIIRNSSTIGSIPASTNGLFKVEHLFIATESPENVDILTLHHRLSHISADAICHLIHSNAITGLHLANNLPTFTCNSCYYAKQRRSLVLKSKRLH